MEKLEDRNSQEFKAKEAAFYSSLISNPLSLIIYIFNKHFDCEKDFLSDQSDFVHSKCVKMK